MGLTWSHVASRAKNCVQYNKTKMIKSINIFFHVCVSIFSGMFNHFLGFVFGYASSSTNLTHFLLWPQVFARCGLISLLACKKIQCQMLNNFELEKQAKFVEFEDENEPINLSKKRLGLWLNDPHVICWLVEQSVVFTVGLGWARSG